MPAEIGIRLLFELSPHRIAEPFRLDDVTGTQRIEAAEMRCPHRLGGVVRIEGSIEQPSSMPPMGIFGQPTSQTERVGLTVVRCRHRGQVQPVVRLSAATEDGKLSASCMCMVEAALGCGRSSAANMSSPTRR